MIRTKDVDGNGWPTKLLEETRMRKWDQNVLFKPIYIINKILILPIKKKKTNNVVFNRIRKVSI